MILTMKLRARLAVQLQAIFAITAKPNFVVENDFNTVMERVSRNREKRPLLRVADPRAKMRELMDARHPIYAKAHITVPIARGPHIRTVHKVIRAIKAHESENA